MHPRLVLACCSPYDGWVTAQQPGAGVWMRPVGGMVYPEGATGKVVFHAPGTSRIREVRFGGVSHENPRHRQTLQLWLFGSWDPQQFSHHTVEPGWSAPEVVLTDPDTASPTSTSAEIWMHTPPCAVGEFDCPRLVPNQDAFLNVESVTLTLVDNDAPRLIAAGELFERRGMWSRWPGQVPLTVGATDEGVGVEAYSLRAKGGEALVDRALACDRLHATASLGARLCPEAGQTDVEVGPLPEGKTGFSLAADDAADNHSDLSWEVYVDRTRPTVRLEGELLDMMGWQRPDGELELSVTAEDGRSGVASYALRVRDRDGELLLDEGEDACAAPGPVEAPCPARIVSGWTLDAAELRSGWLTFELTGTDHAGNRSQAVRTAYVDREPPRAELDIPVEHIQRGEPTSRNKANVNITASDADSGVARVQLFAHAPTGRVLVADQAVCDPKPAVQADHCPHITAATVTATLEDLPDGELRFEAKAIDLVGNTTGGEQQPVANDQTAPGVPRRLTVKRKGADGLRISWERAHDLPGGSGVAGYRVALRVTGERTINSTTAAPSITLADLPPEARQAVRRALRESRAVMVTVAAVDRAGNTSPPSASAAVAANCGFQVGAPFRPIIKKVVRVETAQNCRPEYTLYQTWQACLSLLTADGERPLVCNSNRKAGGGIIRVNMTYKLCSGRRRREYKVTAFGTVKYRDGKRIQAAETGLRNKVARLPCTGLGVL